MKSMTGFGAAEGRCGAVQLTVEVRSVNQRHLDVKLVAPREYGAWDAELRRAVAAEIARGRVEVFINRNGSARARSIVVQKDVAAAYVRGWKDLKKEFGLAGDIDLSLLQGRGEIFQWADAESDPAEELDTVRALLTKALTAHARERKREGAHLKRDMEARVRSLAGVVRGVRSRVKRIVPQLQKRLESKLDALLDGRGVDPARIAQETALLAERADVTEEIVRLDSHLDSLKGLLGEDDSVGKRIDFLLQEVNRELNTIGSKAGDLEVTNFVLAGKSDVEKLREQVQNVE